MLDTVSRPPTPDYRGRTVEIVAAYVAHNSVPMGELPPLLRGVFEALVSVSVPPVAPPEPEVLKPAVPIKKSVYDGFIVCLENGKRFQSLKRHIATNYGLTPDQYRAKWGLPKDYPMVAPAYAKRRSSLARQMGLGRKMEADGVFASVAHVGEIGTETALPVQPEPKTERPAPAKRRRKADAGGS